MKYEVVSCSSLNGTDVIGIVTAENEAVAGQMANERYKPSMRDEDIYVRPARVDKNAERSPGVSGPDHYLFEVEYTGWKRNAAYGGAHDEMSIKISRDQLLRTLTDVLEAGLGKESDTFTINLYGKLSHNIIEL